MGAWGNGTNIWSVPKSDFSTQDPEISVSLVYLDDTLWVRRRFGLLGINYCPLGEVWDSCTFDMLSRRRVRND
jgi:hypothetical protein